jgi:transketolase C-terminal domain/subunit
LGSLVAEVVAERGLSCRIVRCGVARGTAEVTGSQVALQALHGLSGERLAETARQSLRALNR